MSLAREFGSISAYNDKEVVISVINQALYRSATPTPADLNAYLRSMESKACGIADIREEPLEVKDLRTTKRSNYIPKVAVKKSVAQTMTLYPPNTRLPPTTSVSPGPQAYLSLYNSFSGPAFTLSSRYAQQQPRGAEYVGPGTYNVDSHRCALQSTKSQIAKYISLKFSRQPWHSFGPGPGKYDVSGSDLAVSNGKVRREVRLHDGRQDKFYNFCPVNEREVRPGAYTYTIKNQHNVYSFCFPRDGIERPRSANGKQWTARCPDSYYGDMRKISRKLYPEQPRSLRSSELSAE